MMNLHFAWQPGPWRLLLSQVTPWRGDYRPMGSAFYATFFHLFGFDPLPYRIAILLLLGLNVWLAYRFARMLGCGETAATLAAAVVAYHGGLGSLHYNPDTIYDILCFSFYFGAFTFYAAVRRRGRLLAGPEMAAFLALFLCALNSKEIAVSLPVAVLVFEALYHPPGRWNWKEARAWLFGPGRAALCAAALTLVCIYGKKYGPDGLLHSPAYQPVFSLGRILGFQKMWIPELFFLNGIGTLGLLVLWVGLTWLAWRSRRPVLRFCWVFLLVAPLPIEFLEGRDQASLYVPFAGWAVFAAVVALDAAGWAAGLLSKAPGLRALGPRVLLAALLAAALIPWVRVNRRAQKLYVHPAMMIQGQITQPVLREFAALRPRVPPHSQVVFLQDPFDGWDMVFIAELSFGDRTVKVHLQRMENLPPSELAKMRQFTWEGGKLLQLN